MIKKSIKPSMNRWIICGGCFLICFMGYGLAYSSISLYSVSICEAFGFSRGQFSVVMSLLSLSMSIGAFSYGKLSQKFSLKFLMINGVMMIAAGVLFMSFSTTLPMFYFAGILIGWGLSIATVIPASILMLNWFGDKRGGALGIILASTGIGAMVFSPFVIYFIDLKSFEYTLAFSGIILAVLLVPIAVFVIREKPTIQNKEKSQAETTYEEQKQGQKSGLSLKEARKTLTFYFCTITVAMYSIVFVGVTYFIPSYLLDIGLTPMVVGVMISLLSGANAIGKIIMGKINDVFNVSICVTYGTVLFIIAMVIALLIQSPVMAGVFAIIYGLSVSTASFPLTIIVSDFFGEMAYGEILSFIQGIAGLVAALAIPVAGLIYDQTGSYNLIFMVYIGLSIIPFATYFIALKKKPVIEV